MPTLRFMFEAASHTEDDTWHRLEGMNIMRRGGICGYLVVALVVIVLNTQKEEGLFEAIVPFMCDSPNIFESLLCYSKEKLLWQSVGLCVCISVSLCRSSECSLC